MPLHRDQSSGRGLLGYLSYSHADRRLVDRLRVHLKGLATTRPIQFWHETEIQPGEDWASQIGGVIALADVFVLCVSPEYIASEYRYRTEWPAILTRARIGNALVIPVILRPCMWFGFVDRFQAVPTVHGRVRPITQWRRQDEGLAAAVLEINDAIRTHAARGGPVPMIDEWPGDVTVPYAPASAEKLSLAEIDQAVEAVIGRRTERAIT